jgi:uncharacterized repeat protein (TIGR04076 family)
MGIRDRIWNGIKWKFMKKRLRYTDEQLRIFRNNPRNEDVLSKAPKLFGKTIVAEVIDSHGCNSQHHAGDKFYFDAAGNLLTERCPQKICIYALNAITPQIFTVIELLYADVDPNEMRFKHAACFDVGLECGGWGRIAMEIKVEDSKKI